MDRRLMGALRQRQARPVLPPHARRPETARDRATEVARVLPRHGTSPEPRRSGGAVSSFFRKLAWLRQRRQKEDELRDELQFHLDEEAEQLRAQGLADDQAQQAARRDLGNIALVKEDTRAAWAWTLLEQFAQDLRYAARTMGNNKAFTALAA